MHRAAVAAGNAATAIAFLLADPAEAAKVFEVKGKVAMADGVVPRGVTARLQVDLDRNSKFSPFETLSATADEQGTFRLSDDLRAFSFRCSARAQSSSSIGPLVTSARAAMPEAAA